MQQNIEIYFSQIVETINRGQLSCENGFELRIGDKTKEGSYPVMFQWEDAAIKEYVLCFLDPEHPNESKSFLDGVIAGLDLIYNKADFYRTEERKKEQMNTRNIRFPGGF